MAQDLQEGRTGTLPDGTRVIVRNGQIVPYAPGADLLPRARVTGDRRSEEAYWGRRRTQGDPAVTQAEQGVAAARRAEGLLRRQEAQGGILGGTGGIYALPVVGSLAGLFDPEIRELDAVQARQARLERQPGEGAISDFDAAQFVAMTYGKDKPIETNRALIQAQRAVNDATLQKREFEEWFFSNYGTTNGVQEAWRRYSQDNPIFDPQSQSEGQSRFNPNRLTWRQYFTGEGGQETQAQIDAERAAQPPAADGLAGSSQDNPIDLTQATRDQIAGMQGDFFVRYADGTVEQVRLAPDAEGPREVVGNGITRAPRLTPDQAIEARREDQGIGRRVDALVRGAADAATFGLSDEITAGLNTVAPLERGSVGGWSGDWGGAYEQNLALARGLDEADAEQMPLTRGTGQVVGAVGSGVGAARLAPQALRVVPRAAGTTRAANTARIAQNAGRMAVGGALGGGAYGLGSAEGTLPERIPNALEGAGIGAVAAPAASALAAPVIRAVTPAAAAVGRTIARPVAALGEALNVPGAADFAASIRPNALSGAADIYARRFRPDTNALSARVAEQEALGMEPAFIDVIDDARSGTFRALNTRDTAAREAAARLPETRRRNLPARVRRIAEEEISPESRPMTEVMDELAATRRANAREGGMDFANENVRLDDNIASALRGPAARSALAQAANVMEISLDPAERASAEYIRSLASGEGGRGAMLTVREIQDISKALNTAARSAFNSENPTAGPALSGLAKAIRDQGRNQSEGYRNWLTQYADDMQLEEAATTGRNFVTADPNPINERSTNAFVRQAEQATPPEMAVQRAAARGAMEAQGSGPTGARAILENLASNVDQQRRVTALGADTARIAARSDAELRAVQAAQRISPRVGSETATNLADQAGEIAGTARDVMTGNIPNIVGRIGRRIMSRGFNDREAEAISLAAMDPTRTREVIDMLATRMNRTEARNMLRAIRFAATRGAGESAGDEE